MDDDWVGPFLAPAEHFENYSVDEKSLPSASQPSPRGWNPHDRATDSDDADRPGHWPGNILAWGRIEGNRDSQSSPV